MREATRRDRPKGNEAQCPICWRTFHSDRACEEHKPYRMPKTASCKDPTTLAHMAHERRGLAVWARGRLSAPPRPAQQGDGGNP